MPTATASLLVKTNSNVNLKGRSSLDGIWIVLTFALK